MNVGARKERPSDVDLDEDLFDFDEVARQVTQAVETEESLEEVFATFRESAPAEELFPEPAAPDGASEVPAPAAPERPARAPAPPAPEPVRARHAAPPPSPAAPPATARAHPAAETSHAVLPVASRAAAPFSKGVVAIALAVTVLNGLVALVVLRGNARMRDEVRAVGRGQAGGHDLTATPEPHAEPAFLPDPEELASPADHPVLEEARAEIARSEFGAARQRIYTLLAVVDRFPAPRREAVEAECQFLIAQALHLEALERLGRSE
jgi:hypothetical protein